MSIVSTLSGEWLFAGGYRPNGGDVVIYRSAWVTLLIMTTVEVLWNLMKPCQVCALQSTIFFNDLVLLAPWIGAVFGAVYVAFYARFSSQWAYLANLYNLIKEAEVNGASNAAAMAQWKAGFIEDALDLHLASKSNFAGVIWAWAFSSNDVRDAFITYTPNGRDRWAHVLLVTKAALNR